MPSYRCTIDTLDAKLAELEAAGDEHVLGITTYLNDIIIVTRPAVRWTEVETR